MLDQKTEKITLPEGSTISFHKYLGSKFAEAHLAENGITKDSEVEAIKADFSKRFTLNVECDFSGVTVLELVNREVSTTTTAKMLYNNVLKDWTEEQAEKACKTVYKVSVRNLYDERKSSAISEEEKNRRQLKKMKEKGLSREEMLAQVEELYG